MVDISPAALALGSLDLLTVEPDTGVEWVAESVAGWGSPGSTLTMSQKARGHGAWAGASSLRPRALAVEGWMIAPDGAVAAAEDAIDRLIAAASLHETTLAVTTANGSRWCGVRRDDEVMVDWVTPTRARWSFQVAAPDPRKFGAALSDSTGLPSSTGGLVILPDGPNGLTNPGFETDTSTWAGIAPGVVSRVTSEFHSGVASAQVVSSGAGGGLRVNAVSAPAFAAGTKVRVTAWVKAPAGAAMQIRAEEFTLPSTGRQTVSASFTGTGGWSPVEVTLPATGLEGNVVRPLVANASGTPTFWVDDVTVQSVGGLTVPFSIDAVTMSGQVTFTNPGTEAGPVVLRIDGPSVLGDPPLVGPVVTHVASGLSLVFSASLTLGYGEFVTVDMERREVLAQGESTRNQWVTGRGWSQFEPGTNTWSFTAVGFSPSARMTVTATPVWQ